MLQQTQVATVVPYYDRFLRRFPAIGDLAAASEEELLKHWEGLGYYRRARSLHAAAKKIVQQHDGVFPESFDEVLALPGIGRYTAGAILSIAQGQRLPVLEGNTQRVFSRWVALREPPAETRPTKLLWRIAESMLPRDGAGDFNQAAMELGALICLPREPKCHECPVRRSCRAHRDGLEDQIPGKLTKIVYENRTEFALVIADQTAERFLMRPLPDGGRWAGLWDFPRPLEDGHDSAAAAAQWLSRQLGAATTVGSRLKTIKHAVTKYRISLHVHYATCDLPRNLPDPWHFVSAQRMQTLPMSVTGRKIAELISPESQPRLSR